MRNDSRLSRMLHVLIHLAERDGPATSDDIARMLGTNPVVVRRTMGGLRDAGYVRSEKGHGGGWSLARRLDAISLLDIYTALGEPALFAIGMANDDPQCLVERAVNASLGTALHDAETLLRERLRDVTLADVARDFEARMAALPKARKRAS
ncbi:MULTISPECIES: RrF2 family transcriptional regulator [Luteimonas]|uniref:RrF2 family transcriptional regulator n=1 Tax=Luteimonas TaxID=83614 RepID=UPI000C7B714B|nr:MULTISPECIES: Rrf2 family transcriptional regulator [Luteimonas]